jgi:hypothetical protein
VVPTVTWPSHTSIITGVPSAVHNIPTNDQPGQPGQRWWYTKFLKARTLWQAAREKGLKVATLYWPVTVGADVNFNIPSSGGHSHAARWPTWVVPTPNLVDRSRAYPAFSVSMLSDHAVIATRYLLTPKARPGLVHITDLDGDNGSAPSRHSRRAGVSGRAAGLTLKLFRKMSWPSSPTTLQIRTCVPAKAAPGCQVAEGWWGDDRRGGQEVPRLSVKDTARECRWRKYAAGAAAAWKAAFETTPNDLSAAPARWYSQARVTVHGL